MDYKKDSFPWQPVFAEVYNMNKEKTSVETVTHLNKLIKHVKFLSVLCIISLVIIPILLHLNGGNSTSKESDNTNKVTGIKKISNDFEIPPFDDTQEGKMAEYGYRLITETYAHAGPGTTLAVAGNRLSCSSCHLNGGTKPFAAPYVGLSGVFPIYIGRENEVKSLEDRINGCFERSMNGKAMAVNTKEMRAMTSYIKHISKDVPVGKRIEGQGFVSLNVPDRAADLDQGGIVYSKTCASCHGANGEGLQGSGNNRPGGYIYPPLWGEDSYNDGAGMSRLLTAARFIKANMPLGVTHDAPLLTDEQAYDVAAFINSHNRPVKANKELDYPDLAKKPKDAPYPPYDDDISQHQHTLGPFNFGK